MTPLQAFILGIVAGFVLLSIVVETKRRGLSAVQPPMIGAIFAYVDCRGCMATDQRFEWIGVGDSFQNDTHHPGATQIAIRVVKRAGHPYDERDAYQGVEMFFIEDRAIQQVAPGLYFIFK